MIVGVVGVVWPVPARDQCRTTRQRRFEAFIDPEEDPFGEGYNYLFTRLAVGNGGLFGTGLFSKQDPVNLTTTTSSGSSPPTSSSRPWPSRWVSSEELTLLLLFAVLFVRGLRAGAMARDAFGTLLATGIVSYMAFQVFVNIGMTVGLVPITGIPLPFVSYGGSSLVVSMPRRRAPAVRADAAFRPRPALRRRQTGPAVAALRGSSIGDSFAVPIGAAGALRLPVQ